MFSACTIKSLHNRIGTAFSGDMPHVYLNEIGIKNCNFSMFFVLFELFFYTTKKRF